MASNSTQGGFTNVSSSRRKPSRNKYVFHEKTVDDHISDLKVKIDSIKQSKFYQTLYSHIKTLINGLEQSRHPESGKFIRHFRCLALGSPTDSANAMYQLAIQELIITDLEIAPENVTCWDPVFGKNDIELFEKLGYAVAEQGPETDAYKLEEKDTSEELEHSKDSIILFYTMHSPQWLTEQVLRTNANRDIVIIGNNLTSYSNHLTIQELNEKYPIIASAIEDIDETLMIPVQTTNRRKNKSTTTKPDEAKTLAKKEKEKIWDFFSISDKLSKNEAWMPAVNDTAIYWKKKLLIKNSDVSQLSKNMKTHMDPSESVNEVLSSIEDKIEALRLSE